MADTDSSLVKNLFAPAGMVEPPRKVAKTDLPPPDIEKVKGLGIVAKPVVRIEDK